MPGGDAQYGCCMNTNRFEAPPKRRIHRARIVGPVFVTGSVLVFAVLVGALYFLLTHQIPV